MPDGDEITVPKILGILEELAAKRGDDLGKALELFRCAEWMLTKLVGCKTDNIRDAQTLMSLTDANRWNDARSAMFVKAVVQMDLGLS